MKGRWQMELSGEAIDKIAKLVEKAQEPRVEVRGWCSHYLLRNADGTYAVLDEPTAPRSARFSNLESFAEAIKRWGSKEHTSIYLEEDGLTAVLDDELDYRRRECLGFRLRTTCHWQSLFTWSGKAYGHKAFTRQLRVELRDALEPEVLTTIMSLNVSTAKTAEAVLAQGADEMGARVAQKAAFGDTAVPEFLTFRVDVYRDFRGHPKEVQGVLTLEFDDGGNVRFALDPVQEMIELAQEQTLAEVSEALQKLLGGGWHIYRGVPT